MFGQDTFNPSDLLKFVEALLKDMRQMETNLLNQSNYYSWLKSKHLQSDDVIEEGLEELKPMIQKLSPESCTSIAFKLDHLTEHTTTTSDILNTLKNLLEEDDSMTLMAGNVKRGKVMKNKKVKRVHPVLTPPGRQETVSFVFQVEELQK